MHRLTAALALFLLAIAQTAPVAGQSAAEAAAEEARRAAASGSALRGEVATPLRQVVFSPSVWLSSAELRALAAPFVGQPATPARLGALLASIEAAYRARGQVLARAELARLSGGVAEITLREARLERLESAAPGLSPAYLGFRLGLAPGSPADTAALGTGLEALALSDDLELAADFEQGARPELVILRVAAPDRPPFAGSIGIDTFGKRATGEARLSLSARWRDLSGWNDPLSLSMTLAQGSASLQLGYARPILRDGTRAVLSLDMAASQSLRAPVVTSRSVAVEAGLVRVLQLGEGRAQAGLSLLAFRDASDIAGAPFVRQAGIGMRASLGVAYAGEGWFAAPSAALTAIRYSDDVAGQRGLSHVALSMGLSAARRLGDAALVSVQLTAQLSGPTRAPSKYRLGIAGPSGVRGYDPDASSGDSGMFVRLQLERAEPLRLGPGQSARPFLFLDAGRAFDRVGGTHVARAPLASVGVGASIVLGEGVSAELVAARALLAPRDTEIRAALVARF